MGFSGSFAQPGFLQASESIACFFARIDVIIVIPSLYLFSVRINRLCTRRAVCVIATLTGNCVKRKEWTVIIRLLELLNEFRNGDKSCVVMFVAAAGCTTAGTQRCFKGFRNQSSVVASVSNVTTFICVTILPV